MIYTPCGPASKAELLASPAGRLHADSFSLNAAVTACVRGAPSEKHQGGGTINEDQRSMIGISWGDTNPRSSMYGIFTYIWVIYGVYVGKYTIHG